MKSKQEKDHNEVAYLLWGWAIPKMRVWIIFLAFVHALSMCFAAFIGLTNRGATEAISYWLLLIITFATAFTLIILADPQVEAQPRPRWRIFNLLSLWLEAKEHELRKRIVPVQSQVHTRIDARLFRVPDRREIIERMSGGQPLSHMQLWSIDGCPVRIGVDGTGIVLFNGEWQVFDPWELIGEGIPYSFKQFEERWPGLVSINEYLKSFS